jgi:hypothetical protein
MRLGAPVRLLDFEQKHEDCQLAQAEFLQRFLPMYVRTDGTGIHAPFNAAFFKCLKRSHFGVRQPWFTMSFGKCPASAAGSD